MLLGSKLSVYSNLAWFGIGALSGVTLSAFYPSESRTSAPAGKVTLGNQYAAPVADALPQGVIAETSAGIPHDSSDRAFESGLRAAKESADWKEGLVRFSRATDKAAFLAGFATAASPTSWDSLAAAFRELPPGFVKEAALGSLIETMAADRPEEALALATQTLSGPALNNCVSGVAETWGGDNFSAVLAWGVRNPGHPFSAQIMEMAAAGAAREDLLTALSAVSQAPQLGSDLRSAALRSIVGMWAMEDPRAAMAWSANHKRQSRDAIPVESALLNWATQDPAAATQAAATLDPATSEGLVPEAVSLWAAEDPLSAARWAFSQGRTAAHRQSSIANVAEAWGQSDSVGALNWALSLPEDDPARSVAIQNAALAWERFDPQGLRAFIQSRGAFSQDVFSALSEAEAPEEP